MRISVDCSHYGVPQGVNPLEWVLSLTEEQLEAEAACAEEMRETRRCFPSLPLTLDELAEAVWVERVKGETWN